MLEPIKRLFGLKPKPKPIPGLRVESKESTFDREITKSKNQVPTNRPPELILGEHGLTLFDLKGKVVLDAGSGDSTFVRYLKQNKIDAKSLDPSKWLLNKPDYPITVEELTVKDKFDVITCNFSFYYHSNNSLMIRIGFYKLLRALRKDGFVSIVPFVTLRDIRFFNDGRLLRILRSCGFNVVSTKEGIRVYKNAKSDLIRLKKAFGLQALKD